LGQRPGRKGQLYKISYSAKDVPEPLFAQAVSPSEIQIAFDRPIDPILLKQLAKRTTITKGNYVSAGDRFESIRPGYQAVQDQLMAPRYDVPVLSALLTRIAGQLFYPRRRKRQLSHLRDCPSRFAPQISLPSLRRFGAARFN